MTRLISAIHNPRLRLWCLIVLWFTAGDWRIYSQEVISNGILSAEIPSFVTSSREADLFPADSCGAGNMKNELTYSSEFSDILRFRDQIQSYNLWHQTQRLTYSRCLPGPFFSGHRLGMQVEYRLTTARHLANESENRMESKNSLRIYEFNYSGNLIYPFKFNFNAGRTVGLYTADWTYGAGLKFRLNYFEWGFDYKKTSQAHRTSIQYQSDKVYIPLIYDQYKHSVNAGLNQFYGASLKLFYDTYQYDSKNTTINQMTARLNGVSESYGISITAKNDHIIVFTDFSHVSYDYDIYTYKNDLQYGKINVPEVRLTRIAAGLEFQNKWGKGLAAQYQYAKGIEHIGLIIETWPFSSGIGGLLGVKYHNDLDGTASVHQFSVKQTFMFNSNNIIVPKLAVLYFRYDGRYSYRKQDAFFNVYDRGNVGSNKASTFINPGIEYHLTTYSGDIAMSLHQLIPVQAGNILSDYKRALVRGGLFLSVNGIYRF